ncbi:hypothetical protein RclHR1_01960023 [Rhizophagus clarus]|nr:hypothetical protein RclHR1_01960023 [Rhizophagus clarus]
MLNLTARQFFKNRLSVQSSSSFINNRFYFTPICNGVNKKECVCFNTEETRANHWTPNDVCNYLEKNLKEKWSPQLRKVIFDQKINGADLKTLDVEKLKSMGFPLMTIFNIQDIAKRLNAKTIFVQDHDSQGNLLKSFKRIKFYNDDQIINFLKLVEGKDFIEIITNDKVNNKPSITDNKLPSIINREIQDHLRLLRQKETLKNVVISKIIADNHQQEQINEKQSEVIVNTLEGFENFRHYRIDSGFLTAIKNETSWTKTEDSAMKDETSLAVMDALGKIYKSVELSSKKTIMNHLQASIMEWDNIIYAGKIMFLLEAKHDITNASINSEYLNNFIDEIEELKKLKSQRVNIETELLIRRPVGVVCGVNFPQQLRNVAKNKGLVVVYPGGGRYKVKIPNEIIIKFSEQQESDKQEK